MRKKWKTIFAGAFHLVVPSEWGIPEISANPRQRGGGLILGAHPPWALAYYQSLHFCEAFKEIYYNNVFKGILSQITFLLEKGFILCLLLSYFMPDVISARALPFLPPCDLC